MNLLRFVLHAPDEVREALAIAIWSEISTAGELFVIKSHFSIFYQQLFPQRSNRSTVRSQSRPTHRIAASSSPGRSRCRLTSLRSVCPTSRTTTTTTTCPTRRTAFARCCAHAPACSWCTRRTRLSAVAHTLVMSTHVARLPPDPPRPPGQQVSQEVAAAWLSRPLP